MLVVLGYIYSNLVFKALTMCLTLLEEISLNPVFFVRSPICPFDTFYILAAVN